MYDASNEHGDVLASLKGEDAYDKRANGVTSVSRVGSKAKSAAIGRLAFVRTRTYLKVNPQRRSVRGLRFC